MKIAVWDTYVTKEDGTIMHFDILVSSEMTNTEILQKYAEAYLSDKPFATRDFSTAQCNFCHNEMADSNVKAAIDSKGFFIIEMENCS